MAATRFVIWVLVQSICAKAERIEDTLVEDVYDDDYDDDDNDHRSSTGSIMHEATELTAARIEDSLMEDDDDDDHHSSTGSIMYEDREPQEYSAVGNGHRSQPGIGFSKNNIDPNNDGHVSLVETTNSRRSRAPTPENMTIEEAIETYILKSGHKTIAELLGTKFCWKKLYDRGVGHGRVCKRGYSQTGLMCYPDCGRAYYRFADHCIKRGCPRGWTSVLNTCTKWWHFPRTKRHVYRPGKTLLSSASGCRSSRPIESLGLCYRKPRENYTCTLTSCRKNCPPHMVECGVGACAISSSDCASQIVNMGVNVVMALVQTVALIATFGTSASVTGVIAMGKTKMLAVRAAAKASLKGFQKQLARHIVQKTLKKRLKKTLSVKNIDKFIKRNIDEGIIMEKKFIARKVIPMTYAHQAVRDAKQSGRVDKMADASIQATIELYLKQEERKLNNFDITKYDVTGISGAIKKSAQNQDALYQVSAWMNVVGLIDPTGVISAVASFIHKGCA